MERKIRLGFTLPSLDLEELSIIKFLKGKSTYKIVQFFLKAHTKVRFNRNKLRKFVYFRRK